MIIRWMLAPEIINIIYYYNVYFEMFKRIHLSILKMPKVMLPIHSKIAM